MTQILDWSEGDPKTRRQLENTAALPIVGPHVAAMPDAHIGIGATVGSVIPTRHAIIPAAVGVDIGCGMIAVKTNKTAEDLPDNLRQIRHSIERGVPVGNNSHKSDPDIRTEDMHLVSRRVDILDRNPALTWTSRKRRNKALPFIRQLGTLGGGNHFIEICLDENDDVWIMLHSGSRNPGNRIGQHFIEQAKEQRIRIDGQTPLDKDLSWLDQWTPEFNAYVEALRWAQDFAAANRQAMLREVVRTLTHELDDFALADEAAINCHHNYVAQEHHFGEDLWITRKGAINAEKGRMGIIPGSMGTRSYIVRGKGNPHSFCSSAHGAGRRMSRREAKEQFTLADIEAQTAGVECRKDIGVVDEIPKSYKDIDDVMERQSDLTEIVHTLKQICCVKG